MKKFTLAACFAAGVSCVFAAENDVVADTHTTTIRATSSYYSEDDEMYGFHVQGEALYWKTLVQDNYIALQVNSGDPFPISAHSIDWSFCWNWGFRINAGYRFDQCNWGINFMYTQLYSHASNSMQAPLGQLITIPYNPFMDEANNADSIAARFDNEMNMLDGVIERRYQVGERISFYPAFGVKGVWFRQNYCKEFTGGEIAPDASITQRNHLKYSAAGPKVSIASQWNIGCGFGFYENFGISLLVGDSKRSSHQAYTQGEIFYVNNNPYTVFEMVPAVEMQLGAKYEYHFKDVVQTIGINVGVDGQTFFNEFFSSLSGIRGNTSYFGMNLGAFWKF